ncbi:hypothetical protein [Clostridium sp. M14]|uniref:competence protein CoiA family protein n=1 Tax=Clostridium sp. M14 TaxID=2716311 RepID=UPI0013EE9EA5|nr:hypothetical protein [Clostridium sp. M14]MBZ9693406.1 hypothetical protein [Clostridium sp. M14]
MGFENINLWFAKDSNNKTVLAKDITKNIKHKNYICPICNSCVIPKTGDVMTWHFAHKDASKCNSETMIHWWVKNELIKIGDKFKVNIEGKITEYVCKELKIEQKYETSKGIYKPDITIITTSDEIIYVEIEHTNKKKLKDFINIWEELNHTVVEVETRDIINGNKIEYMKAIWYEGKEYYEQLKELRSVCNKEKEKYKFTKEQVDKIDWLISDICKYNQGVLSISDLSKEIQAIEDEELRKLVVSILRNKTCSNIINDYVDYNSNETLKSILSNNELKLCTYKIDKTRLVYDRIYKGFKLELNYNNVKIFQEVQYYENILEDDDIKNGIKYIKLNEYIIQKYKCYKLKLRKYSNFLHECSYGIELFDRHKVIESISYEECVDFVDKTIKENETKINFINNMNSLFEDIKNIYSNIIKIDFSDTWKITIYYKYTNNIIRHYSIDTNNYSIDIEYYKNIILNKIKEDFAESIGLMLKNNYNVLYFTKWCDETTLYIKDKSNSIPVQLEFKILDDYEEYLKNIINIRDEKIRKCELYNSILEKYCLKCDNTKNNYVLTLLNNELSIYYKDRMIENINLYTVNNIEDITNNNINLSKSIIEDIKDYEEYYMIKNVIEKINYRYIKYVNDNWRVEKYKDSEIRLSKNGYSKSFIDIPKDFITEEDLFNKLINIISKDIRYNLYE